MHVCFRRSEPGVVLGSTDSGVTNPARGDGTTLLDEIWAGAPFASEAVPVARVRTTVAPWVPAGLLGAADGRRVVTTAQNTSCVP